MVFITPSTRWTTTTADNYSFLWLFVRPFFLALSVVIFTSVAPPLPSSPSPCFPLHCFSFLLGLVQNRLSFPSPICFISNTFFLQVLVPCLGYDIAHCTPLVGVIVLLWLV
eukprot:GILI01031322.1.p1 GENE.GILI01031322.1~~GILI01031322.1.p1  ORF type:complete len:111 (-),score=0.33 GILI01031322.1:1-333(-)